MWRALPRAVIHGRLRTETDRHARQVRDAELRADAIGVPVICARGAQVRLETVITDTVTRVRRRTPRQGVRGDEREQPHQQQVRQGSARGSVQHAPSVRSRGVRMTRD